MSREEMYDQESGGGLRNFILRVDEALFAIDEKYSEATGSDVYFMHWGGQTNLPDRPIMQAVAGEFHPKWALDPDFISTDGGKTVVSQSGRKKKVGKAYGRLCVDAATITEALKGTPADPFGSSISPRDASLWLGTVWRIDEVTREFGGQIKPVNELTVVEYLGRDLNPMTLAEVTAAPAAAPAAPQAAAVAPQAVATAPVAAPVGNGTVEALRAELLASAIQASDYRAWQGQWIADARVRENPELLVEIANPSAGIWATAHPAG